MAGYLLSKMWLLPGLLLDKHYHHLFLVLRNSSLMRPLVAPPFPSLPPLHSVSPLSPLILISYYLDYCFPTIFHTVTKMINFKCQLWLCISLGRRRYGMAGIVMVGEIMVKASGIAKV